MSRKRHKPEEIVAKLRQVDVLLAQGHTVADAIRSIGVTEVTYELLDGEIFYTLKEAQIVIESWRVHYNTLWTPPVQAGSVTSSAMDASIYPASWWSDHAPGHDEDPRLPAS